MCLFFANSQDFFIVSWGLHFWISNRLFMLKRLRYTDNIQWLLAFIYSSHIVMDEYDGIALCRLNKKKNPFIYLVCSYFLIILPTWDLSKAFNELLVVLHPVSKTKETGNGWQYVKHTRPK